MGWEGQIAGTEEKRNAYTFLVENSDGNTLLADLCLLLNCILKQINRWRFLERIIFHLLRMRARVLFL
jgi:hypothetical protein